MNKPNPLLERTVQFTCLMDYHKKQLLNPANSDATQSIALMAETVRVLSNIYHWTLEDTMSRLKQQLNKSDRVHVDDIAKDDIIQHPKD